MAKISKRLLNKHNEVLKLLEKDTLNFNERELVFEHYHEGAGKMNNLISAHFTPPEIALSMQQSMRNNNFVDLCAGIGMLSYKIVRSYEFGKLHNSDPIKGVCIENSTEYYNVGKKLLPELLWINGDIFDEGVIQQIKDYMGTEMFSIISNPPYGKQVKTNTKELLKYTGSDFEYKAIELGAILGANDGVFLIPQGSCPFKMTGVQNSFDKKLKSKEYIKFVENTGIEITPNNGFTTEIYDEERGWKDVNIVTEIAIVEYDELDYEPIAKKQTINQQTLF